MASSRNTVVFVTDDAGAYLSLFFFSGLVRAILVHVVALILVSVLAGGMLGGFLSMALSADCS